MSDDVFRCWKDVDSFGCKKCVGSSKCPIFRYVNELLSDVMDHYVGDEDEPDFGDEDD